MGKSLSSLLQIMAEKYISYFKRKSAQGRSNTTASSVVAPPPADRQLRYLTQPSMNTSSTDLPRDLIEDILLRCPVKSVIRFKSVSRSWQTIISDPRFSRTLRSKLSKNRNKFVVWATPQGHYMSTLYCIKLEDGKLQTEPVSGYPTGDNFYVVSLCSCDGLILLSTNLNRYILWNPFIGKNITIPIHPRPEQHYFYHDSVSNDHMIVFVYVNCYAVYSCKNMRWGETKEFPRGLDLTQCQAFVDGCFYLKKDNDEILCFDCGDGELHEFRQPDDIACRVQLKAVSGRLCLYSLVRDGRPLQLWVMEKNGSFEKSWRKLTVSMGKLTPYVTDAIPVCFSNDDDHVVLWTDIWAHIPPYVRKGKHMLYNARENSFKPINFTWEYSERYFPYSENLYMPSSSIC